MPNLRRNSTARPHGRAETTLILRFHKPFCSSSMTTTKKLSHSHGSGNPEPSLFKDLDPCLRRGDKSFWKRCASEWTLAPKLGFGECLQVSVIRRDDDIARKIAVHGLIHIKREDFFRMCHAHCLQTLDARERPQNHITISVGTLLT
jgi:hypothetical protein